MHESEAQQAHEPVVAPPSPDDPLPALRAELKRTGVRTTLLSPEAVDTAVWDELDPVTRAQFPASTKMLASEDVAGAILYAVTQPDSVNVDEIRISTT